MAKKITIAKLENDQVEVGIQLRDNVPPVPKNNRIEFSKADKSLKCRVNDTDYSLSLDVVQSDPITPLEKQVWINETTNQMKWRFGGITKVVELDNKMKVNASSTASEMLVSLDEVELKKLSGNETSPKTFIDAFIELLEDVALTDTEIINSTLRVENGSTNGKYELERRTSGASNYAEGVIVTTAQGLAPISIVSNSGVHTLTFKNDITGVLADTSKVLMYEEENVNNVIKGYHLLRNLKPAVLEIDSVNYDLVTDITTVVITDALDLTFGKTGDDIYKLLRLFPLNIKISAGANSLTGTMTNIEIQEAYTMDNIIRVVGKTMAFKIMDSYRAIGGRGAMDFAVAHSPNKMNWIIPMVISRGNTDSCIHVMYSTDGLQTINKLDYQGELSFPANVGTIASSFLGDSHLWVSDILTHVSDDGRFLFHRIHYHGVYAYTYEYGHLNPVGAQPWIRRANAYFGGYRGIIGHEANTTYHYYPNGPSAMDWDNNLMAFHTSQHSNENAYVFFALIDWDNHIDYGKGYMDLGSDYAEVYHTNGIAFFKNFEGEDMYFNLHEHTNNHLYAKKVQVSNILAKLNDCGSSSIASFHAFSNSTHGGNRGDYNSFLHADGADDAVIIDHAWDTDDDRLVMIKADTQDSRLTLAILDFGRTTGGAFSNHKWEFSAVPDNGNFTFDVTDELSSTTETTSPIPYSADSALVKSTIEGLSFVTSATVTGDWVTGYDITIETKKPVTMVANSNSLTDINSDPITITHTMVEEGYEPVWLRMESVNHSVQPFTPESGGCLNLNDGNLHFPYDYYIGDDSNGRSMAKAYGHRLIVEGKKVIFTGMFRDVDNDYDTYIVRLFKIPNYEQFYGCNVQRNSSGTLAGFSIRENTEKIAHKLVMNAPVWAGIYPDNKIPIRTIRLYLKNNWYNTTAYRKVISVDGTEVMFNVKLVGVDGSGNPDESNVIAVCKYSRPVSELHAYDDWKWEEFVFDNAKVDIGQELFILIDTNITQQQIIDSNFMVDVGVASQANGPVYGKFDGVWTKRNYNMWFEIFDFYQMKLHVSHDAGWNNCAMTGAGFNDWAGRTVNDSITMVSPNHYKASYSITPIEFNDTTYAEMRGKSNSYIFDIDDSLGAERLPVIGSPKLIGYKESDYDEFLHLMFYPCIDSGREGDERVLERDNFTSNVYVDGTHYKVQRQTQVGAYNISEDDYCDRLLTTPDGYTNHSDGQIVDDRFAMGMATKHNGNRLRFNGSTNFELPHERDFIYEVEICADSTDLDNGDNHILSTYYAFILGIYYNRYRFASWNNGQSADAFSYEECPLDTYHRLRVIRDENGLRIYRNFSKIGGTWEQLQLGYNNSDDGSWWANGTLVGRTDAHTNIALGGYTYDTNYQWHGLTGYVKMATGTTEFKYEGCINTQMPIFNNKLFGNVIFAMKQIHAYGQKFSRTIVDTLIIKDNEGSSLVPTNDQVLKFGEAIEAGQKPALKLELNKVSDSDVASVQGYSVKFDKK